MELIILAAGENKGSVNENECVLTLIEETVEQIKFHKLKAINDIIIKIAKENKKIDNVSVLNESLNDIYSLAENYYVRNKFVYECDEDFLAKKADLINLFRKCFIQNIDECYRKSIFENEFKHVFEYVVKMLYAGDYSKIQIEAVHEELLKMYEMLSK